MARTVAMMCEPSAEKIWTIWRSAGESSSTNVYVPAGTYTFVLLDSPADRHIVQIFSADGSHIIATVLAINNYRLKPTGDTVVKFAERAGDNPEALKAWFYPGDNFGQEFVYSKKRAIELAVIVKE